MTVVDANFQVIELVQLNPYTQVAGNALVMELVQPQANAFKGTLITGNPVMNVDYAVQVHMDVRRET